MSWVERLLRPRRWWTLDDRGVRHVMFNPNDRIVNLGNSDIDNAELAKLRKQSGADMTIGVRIVGFVLLLVLTHLWSKGAGEAQATGGWSHYLTFAIPLTICLFVLVCRGTFGLWRKPGRFRATMLKLWRCPVCTYRLDGPAVAEDACTVCPECGAAWKMNRGKRSGLPS